MFRWYWLMRFIRSNTTPIELNKAERWKQRLSIVYAIVAWNAFAVVLYACFNGKADWAAYTGVKPEEDPNLTSGQKWAKYLNAKNPEIYRVTGLSVVKIQGRSENEENSEVVP